MRIFTIFMYLIFFFLSGFIQNARVQKALNQDPKEGYRLGNDIVRNGFIRVLRISGVKCIVKGRKNIPTTAALYVGNHRSYFDILTTHVTIQQPVGYIAKAEMINIPFLAQWMKNIGCLFLNRSNNKEALKTILEGVNMLKNDYCSLYIFPEGTRGHTDEMAPFKKGSFKMAEKAHVPIIPVGIVGSDDVFEKNGWFRKVRGKKVYLNFGEPIYFANLDEESQKHIDAYVQNIVADLIAEMKAEI